MGHVICTECGSDRPDELATGGERTPCLVCGGTAITIRLSVAAHAVATASAKLTMALRPVEQTRGWRQRWQLIRADLARQLLPRTETLSVDSIRQAQHELHSLFVQAYNWKDALITETAIGRGKIETTITSDPDLALLADLANLDKHPTRTKPARSGDYPRIVDVQGITGSGESSWTLKMTIEHKGM